MIAYTIVAVVFLIDYFCCKYVRGSYDLEEARTSLFFVGGEALIVLVGLNSSSLVYPDYVKNAVIIVRENLMLVDLNLIMPRWLAFVCLFVMTDFLCYVAHRMSHEIGLFWAQHSIHHSFTRMTSLAAHRNPISILRLSSKALLFVTPVAFGFTPGQIVFAVLLIQTWQMIIHSEWIPRFWRPFEYVLSTPYHHRIHHQKRAPGTTGNYGGALIIFDRMFGSCIETPRGQPEVFEFGLVSHEPTNNPFKLIWQTWVHLGRSAWESRSFLRTFEIFFVPVSFVKKYRNVQDA